MFASIFTLCIQSLDKEIESIGYNNIIIQYKTLSVKNNINTVIIPVKKINYNADPIIKERQEFIVKQCEIFGVNPFLALNIISCEGGFRDPENCNNQFGCSGGQGPWQFIKSTWFSTQARMGDILPIECREGDMRGTFKCNAMAGAWLLATDGDGHWREWSGSCYLR